MSRFILVKSKVNISPIDIVKNFSKSCYSVPQEDKLKDNSDDNNKVFLEEYGKRLPIHGWKFSYLNESTHRWSSYFSFEPLSNDLKKKSAINKFKECKTFTLHAQYTPQPRNRYSEKFISCYVNDGHIFTLDGSFKISNTSIEFKNRNPVQKIWSLTKNYLSQNLSMEDSLNRVMEFVQNNTSNLSALNIGLSSKNNISALTVFKKNGFIQDYYTLYFYNDNYISIICSNELEGYRFKPMPSGSFLVY